MARFSSEFVGAVSRECRCIVFSVVELEGSSHKTGSCSCSCCGRSVHISLRVHHPDEPHELLSQPQRNRRIEAFVIFKAMVCLQLEFGSPGLRMAQHRADSIEALGDAEYVVEDVDQKDSGSMTIC